MSDIVTQLCGPRNLYCLQLPGPSDSALRLAALGSTTSPEGNQQLVFWFEH
jgi:hypothetical protein